MKSIRSANTFFIRWILKNKAGNRLCGGGLSWLLAGEITRKRHIRHRLHFPGIPFFNHAINHHVILFFAKRDIDVIACRIRIAGDGGDLSLRTFSRHTSHPGLQHHIAPRLILAFKKRGGLTQQRLG